MFRVSRQIDFCYGHRLLNYAGKCRFLHGHNGRAIITIESETLDERGMVLDFTEIKRLQDEINGLSKRQLAAVPDGAGGRLGRPDRPEAVLAHLPTTSGDQPAP